MVKTVNFKLVTKKDGSCTLYKGKKKIVEHTGKGSRSRCLKATEIEKAIIMADLIRKKGKTKK